MNDKCPNCGSESRDFRGITGMLGAICSDEWHDEATVLDDKDKRIEALEAVIRDVVIPYIDPVDTDVLDPVVKVLEGGADERTS